MIVNDYVTHYAHGWPCPKMSVGSSKIIINYDWKKAQKTTRRRKLLVKEKILIDGNLLTFGCFRILYYLNQFIYFESHRMECDWNTEILGTFSKFRSLSTFSHQGFIFSNRLNTYSICITYNSTYLERKISLCWYDHQFSMYLHNISHWADFIFRSRFWFE